MTTCTNKNCGYEWKARALKPKSCPKCKNYLKAPAAKRPKPQQ